MHDVLLWIDILECCVLLQWCLIDVVCSSDSSCLLSFAVHRSFVIDNMRVVLIIFAHCDSIRH